jgi:hypothetical protein
VRKIVEQALVTVSAAWPKLKEILRRSSEGEYDEATNARALPSARRDPNDVSNFGWGMSKQDLNKWFADPRMPDNRVIVLGSVIMVAAVLLLKAVFFVLQAILSLSYVFVVCGGVTLLCMTLLYIGGSL